MKKKEFKISDDEAQPYMSPARVGLLPGGQYSIHRVSTRLLVLSQIFGFHGILTRLVYYRRKEN